MAQYASERARNNLLPPPSSTSSTIPPLLSTNSPIASSSAITSPASQSSVLSAPDGTVRVRALRGRAGAGPSRRSLSTDATAVELDLEDGEQEAGKLKVLLDFGASASGSGSKKRPRSSIVGGGESSASFVYDAELVRAAVFPPTPFVVATPSTRKKRKLDTGAGAAASPVESGAESAGASRSRTILLYNDSTT